MRATIACLLFVFGPAYAEDALDAALSGLRTASPSETDAAVQAVLDASPDRSAVIARLSNPFAVATKEHGWRLLQATDDKGVARPFELFVPQSIVGKPEPVPLLVAMHGGVSRPAYPETPGQSGAASLWVASAEQQGFVIACPAGRADCVWWSDAGAAHVRAVIRETKRHAPIDDDAVLGTGFSDGGSGCYYLGMAEPIHFAGFLPMNGHPAVASSASGKQLYVENLGALPNFVAMTQDDQLYPALSVLPHLQAAMEAGALLHIVNYPRGGHTPVYFEEQRAAFAQFVSDTSREPHPRALSWKCADPAQGRIAWAEILTIGPSDADPAAAPDRNVTSTPGRVRIGVGVDQNFTGDGVRINQVSAGTLAAQFELQVGDVIVSMDSRKIAGMDDLRRVLDGKNHGDDVALAVQRGDETITARGRFPDFVPSAIYPRDRPTAEFALESEGSRIVVRCRNVRRFRLRLPRDLFGEDDIALAVNGKRVQADIRVVPLEAILRAYARDADAGLIPDREVIVDVP